MSVQLPSGLHAFIHRKLLAATGGRAVNADTLISALAGTVPTELASDGEVRKWVHAQAQAALKAIEKDGTVAEVDRLPAQQVLDAHIANPADLNASVEELIDSRHGPHPDRSARAHKDSQEPQ